MACCTENKAASPVASPSPSPCCPPGSHGPAAPPEGYVAKGAIEDVDGVSCYIVGSGSAAVIVGHDAFGIESGRTQPICDELAQDLGVLVVLPMFFEGNFGAGGHETGAAVSRAIGDAPGAGVFERAGHWMKALYNMPAFLRGLKGHGWDVCGPKADKVFAMLKGRGIENVGVFGFCWGGWMVTHLSSRPDVFCGVTMHPSQSQMSSMLKEDFRELCEAVRCPQMNLAANEDKPEVKEGGVADQVFKGKPFAGDCVFRTFSEMKHGWTNRGSLEDPAVRRDADEALRLGKDFIRKHLLGGA